MEAFAHYEVLRGLQEAYDNLTTLVQSLSEGDASALDELPPEISVLVEDMRADRMTFENMVQHPLCVFHGSDYISHEWMGPFVGATQQNQKYFGHKMEGKKLKFLRKRHLAALIARSIHEDWARLKNHMPHSLTLATLMTFLWQTYENGADLKAFYEAVAGHDLDWDPIQVETKYMKDEMASVRAQIMAAPDQFWTQPAGTQRTLLSLEVVTTGYELPDSGMACVDGWTYSDCVGTMTRCALMDAMRTADGESLVGMLPEGPFQAFFQTYGHKKRMEKAARDAWAEANNTVPHAKRVRAGGLEPSVENVVLVLQHMMGDKEPVVAAVDSEQAFRAARTRYQNFLPDSVPG